MQHRSDRGDRMWINTRLTTGIRHLNSLKIRRLAEARHVPVQVSQPAVDGGVVVAHHLQVALKVLHVHYVEAGDRRVQPYVGVRQPVAEEIRPRGGGGGGGGEVGFEAVEGCEYIVDAGFVGCLCTAVVVGMLALGAL